MNWSAWQAIIFVAICISAYFGEIMRCCVPGKEGEVAGQPLDVFIAGDDDDATKPVAQLVHDGGLRTIDVGPLERTS